MQINSDFTLDNTPQVSVAMRCFIFALAREAVLHSGSFVKRKKQLKAYCEYEMLNYSILEYNLNLFFELFEDYRKTNDPVLYSFLKLQAGFSLLMSRTSGYYRSPHPVKVRWGMNMSTSQHMSTLQQVRGVLLAVI